MNNSKETHSPQSIAFLLEDDSLKTLMNSAKTHKRRAITSIDVLYLIINDPAAIPILKTSGVNIEQVHIWIRENNSLQNVQAPPFADGFTKNAHHIIADTAGEISSGRKLSPVDIASEIIKSNSAPSHAKTALIRAGLKIGRQ